MIAAGSESKHRCHCVSVMQEQRGARALVKSAQYE